MFTVHATLTKTMETVRFRPGASFRPTRAIAPSGATTSCSSTGQRRLWISPCLVCIKGYTRLLRLSVPDPPPLTRGFFFLYLNDDEDYDYSNWQHHSKKQQKTSLKPQAKRAA